MSFAKKSLSVFGKLSVVLLLLCAFSVGLGGVLYLSLRSPEVKVPEIVGKDFFEGEKELASPDLKLRKRTDRFSQEKPNTILEQIPSPGEMVKAGQTISVVVSRAQAEGDEKPAEVKKKPEEDKPKSIDEPSEVDKARKKRKEASKNANANKNANSNGNLNSNSNSNSGSNDNANSSNSNSNSNRGNNNTRNSNSNGNANNRPTGNSNSGTRIIITPSGNRNMNRRPN